jgi:hypothetical protein
MLYRIYTADINRAATLAVVAKAYDSFTAIEALGYFKGTAEPSLVIELLTEDSWRDRSKVTTLADAIRQLNNQQAVLVSCCAEWHFSAIAPREPRGSCV